MTIGIVGLGLIGASMAKAFQAGGHEVFGCDTDDAILSFAQLSGVIEGVLDERSIDKCEVVLLAVYPGDAVAYLEKTAPNIAENTLVIDCCGVKRAVCSKCFPLAARHGFVFVGGHPMAGSHKGGFKNSRADLFHGASMIIVPPVYDDPALFGRIEETLKPAGFGHIQVTTAEKHDEMVAFTSQMAHVVSNAYVKNPSAREHKGFSAGSYQDLTRVARLDADMWGELCMDNSESLIQELDIFMKSVALYRDALAARDLGALVGLFREGSRLKGELDPE